MYNFHCFGEQHASELQAKGDAARGALDDSKRAMGLLRETITQKDQGIQSLQNQIEVLIEKLAFKTSKEEEANMEKKRKDLKLDRNQPSDYLRSRGRE